MVWTRRRGPVGGGLYRVVTPIIITPLGLTKWSWQFSPLGFTKQNQLPVHEAIELPEMNLLFVSFEKRIKLCTNSISKQGNPFITLLSYCDTVSGNCITAKSQRRTRALARADGWDPYLGGGTWSTASSSGSTRCK